MVFDLRRLCVPKAIPLPKEVVQQSTRLLSQSPFSLFQSSPPLLNQQLLWAPVHDLWVVRVNVMCPLSEHRINTNMLTLPLIVRWCLKRVQSKITPMYIVQVFWPVNSQTIGALGGAVNWLAPAWVKYWAIILVNLRKKVFLQMQKLPNLFVHLDRKPLTHMAAVKTVDSGSILAIHIISTLSLESDYNS